MRLTYFLVWVRATGPHQYPIPCKIDVVLVEVGFHILLSSFFLGYEANFYFVRNGEIKRNAVAHHITIPTKENCVPFSWKATNYKVAGYFYYLLFIVCWYYLMFFKLCNKAFYNCEWLSNNMWQSEYVTLKAMKIYPVVHSHDHELEH